MREVKLWAILLILNSIDMTPDQTYDLLKTLISVGLPIIGVLVAGLGGAIVGAFFD